MYVHNQFVIIHSIQQPWALHHCCYTAFTPPPQPPPALACIIHLLACFFNMYSCSPMLCISGSAGRGVSEWMGQSVSSFPQIWLHHMRRPRHPTQKNAGCCCNEQLKSLWVSWLIKHTNVQVMQNESQKSKHGFIKCGIFVIIRVLHFGGQAAVLISEFFFSVCQDRGIFEAACWGNDVRHNGE